MLSKDLTSSHGLPPGFPETAIVVGAGVVGTACALRLARMGIRTRLIDWRDPGEGCSSGNAGSISSDSVVPIAMPGILAQVPRWLFDPLGPLHVRWQYLPRAMPWLVRWVLASRDSTVQASSSALRALLHDAVDDYAELLGQAAFDRLVRQRGQLLVWESSDKSRSERAGHALRERHGVAMRWLTPADIHDLEPGLAPIFARGLLLERHGHLTDPLQLVRTMAAMFTDLGGTIEKGRVLDVTPGDAGGGRVLLEGGASFAADRVVVAAGAWSGRFARRLGAPVPLDTERGYHVSLPGMQGLCSRPIMHAERSFIASPVGNGLRVAGTVEIAGRDAAPRYDRAAALLTHARRMFRGVDAKEPDFWMGCRPSLPDSLPVIDRSPRFPAILFAFGHGHLGMTGAPMTAKIIGDMVAGAPPAIDCAPFRITRFGRRQIFRNSL